MAFRGIIRLCFCECGVHLVCCYYGISTLWNEDGCCSKLPKSKALKGYNFGSSVWLPIYFKIQQLFNLYSTGFSYIFNGCSVYVQQGFHLYLTSNSFAQLLFNSCSIFIQRDILFYLTHFTEDMVRSVNL